MKEICIFEKHILIMKGENKIEPQKEIAG